MNIKSDEKSLLISLSLARKKNFCFYFVTALASVLSLQPAFAQINRTWIGTVNEDWYNPTNWTPNGVPATNDIVNFTNINGTIDLSAPVVIANQFNWLGGTLNSNALTIESNAVLNINGTSTMYLNCALTNAGTVNWTNNLCTLDVENGFGSYFGLIVNLPGALFNIENDVSMYDTIAANGAYFLNEGALQKSAGTGITYIYISLVNSGSVTALQGTFNFYGSGLLAGTFTAGAGTAIDFGAGGNGNFTNSVPVSINGPGTVQLTGGTLTLLKDVIPNLGLTGGTVDLGPAFQGGTITNLTIDGATLTGTNIVTGAFNWDNGTISGGPLTIAKNAVLNINGNTTLLLQSPLTNAGTVNFAGTGGLDIQYGGSTSGLVVNATGALWNIENDQSIYNNISPGAYFQNAGILEKSADTGITSIYIPVINSGSVTALQGTLDFYGGGPLAATFTANIGAAINFAGGGFTNSVPVTINGPGTVQLEGGTLTLLTDTITNLPLTAGTVNLGPAFQGGAITNLTINGATLAGTNTVTGTFNWNNGTIAGPLTIATNGVLDIAGSTTLTLESPLTNAGTVNFAGTGSLNVQYGGSTSGLVVNVTGALWNIENNQSIFDNAIPGAYFQNAGTLEKSASTGTAYIYIPTTNSGAVTALKGNLTFEGAFTPIGGEMLFGLSSATSFGTVSISGNGTLGGTVGVLYENGIVPASGNSFTVLTYGSFSGTFTNTSLPAGPIWVTNYTPTSFTISVSSLNKLAFTTQPVGNVLTNVTLAPVVVQVEDPSNNFVAVSGTPITLALNSGVGTLNGTLTQNTDATGKAIFANLSVTTAGTKTLRATTPLLTQAVSVPFQILLLLGLQVSHSGFLIQLNGNNDLNPLSIYASTNLFTWTLIYTNGPTNGQIQILDSAATNYPARFYHLIIP
ncbi:MAG TPA: hypothetical protein VGY56_02730 [Verrucomicrobiae bacterium]|nr:hypothetical protein [Verrucomicrobiae bacterium]